MLLLSTPSLTRALSIRERGATMKNPDRSRSFPKRSLISGLCPPALAKGGTAMVTFL
jgi:hypothetical protein